jgi:hypothetical protein
MASPAYEQLGKEIHDYVVMSADSASKMERINSKFQPVLISLAVLASSRIIFHLGNVEYNAGPWLSVAVAIATGLDKWLKPEARYKAHYRFNDDFMEFRLEYLSTKDEPGPLAKLIERFKRLVDNYASSVL